MFCTHCGATLDNDAKFCPACGEPCAVTPAQPNSTPVHTQEALELSEEEKKEKDKLSSKALTWGILGLIFSLQTGFLGIIFSIIGLNKSKKFVKKYKETCAKVKTAHALAKAGLIVGIVITIVLALTVGLTILMTVLENAGYLPADTSPIVYSPYTNF